LGRVLPPSRNSLAEKPAFSIRSHAFLSHVDAGDETHRFAARRVFFDVRAVAYNDSCRSKSNGNPQSGALMGIRFSCPNGHKLNVKTFLAGKRAICPDCGAKVIVPNESEVAVASTIAFEPGTASFGSSVSQQLFDVSPSVLVDIDENEPVAAAVVPSPTAAISESLPDSIIAATAPSAVTAHPTAATDSAAYDPRRERTRRNQMLMAVALLFVVVVLAGVLIWVLKRSATSTSTSEPAPAKTTYFSPEHSFYSIKGKV
jgi:hypothetical protein